MGFGVCRFQEETGCSAKSSFDYEVYLPDLNVVICAPEMWKHYMMAHFVLPNPDESEVIMRCNPAIAKPLEYPASSNNKPRYILVMYVEKTYSGYTHNIGTEPNTVFMSKLESILAKAQQIHTKSF